MVPKSGSLSTDEQQRMQQYNQMIPGRNIPQSNMSASGAIPGTDRGVRILPGANGMGVMGGVNRNLPMARPGFQGIPSSSNPGNMASPGMSPTSMHPGVGAGPGSSMLRPRETLHMMRVRLIGFYLFLCNLVASGNWLDFQDILNMHMGYNRNSEIKNTSICIHTFNSRSLRLCFFSSLLL